MLPRIARRPVMAAGIPLVRSSYEGLGFTHTRDHARLLNATRFLIEPSSLALEHDASVFKYPRKQMRVVPGAVDTERFDPTREVPNARQWLNIPQDALVIGIVARLQRHRRFEDFFAALHRLISKVPNTHAIIVGRGTRQDQVAYQPVKDLGIENHVHFPGYVDGENYVGVLKAFDIATLLVPGTDGTCRAIREAMAMGKPAVVADRGMLNEIVDDGRNGLVCGDSADALFEAFNRLAADRSQRFAMGRDARKKAQTEFSLTTQGKRVLEIYSELSG